MKTDQELDILNYLLEQIHIVAQYTKGYDEEFFLRDDKTKDAVITRLVAIGEYSSRIDETTKERFDFVEWRTIKAARNYYTHVYRGIDWILVWHVVKNELADLKVKVEQIVVILEKEKNAKTN